tara:strand:- start:2989 stop:4464 length:1476 start_codon:yes stop_codon:yes gene_type:complete
MSINKIIKLFLIINLIILIAGYIVGFDKPFWIDEIVSINYGSNFPFLSLNEIFTQDTHSPFFYFLIFLGQKILETIFVNENFNYYFLRIINIFGFIPIYYSYSLIKKEKYKTKVDISIFFLLLISSNYFFYYILDLRFYFLLLSFSLLINVINLINTVENENKTAFLISSIFLSMLHIYGLTISMSILVYRLIKNIYLREKRKINLDIIFIILLLSIFIIFYFPSIFNEENMQRFRWIENNLWYYRIFIEWTIATLLLIFAGIFLLLYFYRKEIIVKHCREKFFKSDFFYQTVALSFPAIILMSVVLTISFLFIPIVHYRPLIIIYPNLVLYASILSSLLIDTKKFKSFFIVFLVFLTFVNSNFYFKNIINTHENIEWVIKKTFTKNCNKIPVYFNDNKSIRLLPLLDNIILLYSKYNRPILSLSELNVSEYKKIEDLNKDCKIHIFTFHSKNFEKNIEYINNKNLKLKIMYAPKVIKKNSSKAGAIALSK